MSDLITIILITSYVFCLFVLSALMLFRSLVKKVRSYKFTIYLGLFCGVRVRVGAVSEEECEEGRVG